MQTPTPAPAPTPGTPAALPQPVVVQVNPQPQMRPITRAEMSAIRQRRNEMSDQLTSAQRRRENILDELRDAPAGTEPGLQQQVQVLSDRIVAIERDLEASGQTLRTGLVPQGTILVAPRGSGFDRTTATDAAERGAALGLTALVVLIVVATWRRFRRRRGDNVRTVVYDERMERLEQAVDAIAIEIERVGESQRYQAKLLAEANLMPAMGSAQKEPVRVRDYEDR